MHTRKGCSKIINYDIKMKLKPFITKLSSRVKFKRIIDNKTQSIRIKSGMVNLGPGESVGEHSTDDKEEVILVLSGKAKISFNSFRSLYAESGSLIYIPPDTVHNVLNASTKKLRYVYIVNIR